MRVLIIERRYIIAQMYMLDHRKVREIYALTCDMGMGMEMGMLEMEMEMAVHPVGVHRNRR